MLEVPTIPALYLYVARLIRMFPFTQYVVSYISQWPNICKQHYNDPFLIKIAHETYADEKGHDTLILKDLKDLKIPIELALKEFRSESVTCQLSSFMQSVSKDPIHLLAWLYHAEKLAVDRVTQEILERYQKILGPFRKAIRFWKIHSAVGLDAQHVEKRRQWIQDLPQNLREIIEKELDRVSLLFSNQKFDLDCEKFARFIDYHAPHLYDLAYQDEISEMDQFPF